MTALTAARRTVVTAAAALVLVLIFGSLASAGDFRVRAKEVDPNVYRWRPRSLTVPDGSRVVWRIVDGIHNVTSTSNNWSKASGNIGEGGRTTFTFNTAGTYRYRCTLHSTLSGGDCNGMCGKVIVT